MPTKPVVKPLVRFRRNTSAMSMAPRRVTDRARTRFTRYKEPLKTVSCVAACLEGDAQANRTSASLRVSTTGHAPSPVRPVGGSLHS